MQLFILGAPHKVALQCAHAVQTQLADDGIDLKVYDAKAWIEKEFSETPEGDRIYRLFPREYRANRHRFARLRYAEQPLYGLRQYDAWLESEGQPDNVLVVHPLSPDEFIAMVQEQADNAVIRISGEAKDTSYPDALDEGQVWIEQYLAWRERLGCPIPVFSGTEQQLELELQRLMR